MNRAVPPIVLAFFSLALLATACSGDSAGRTATALPTSADTSAANPASESSGQWIKGLTVTSVTTALKQKGFDCSGPITFDSSGEPMQQWDCKKRGDGKNDSAFPSRSVSIVAKDQDHVRGLNGLFLDLPSSTDPGLGLDFFKTLAGIPYADANTAAAQKWIETNSANGGQTTFGSARFNFVAGRELRILAAGLQ